MLFPTAALALAGSAADIRGVAEPVYVTPRNINAHLIETTQSIRLRWTRDLQLWLVFALLPVSPGILLFWYLGRMANRGHRDTGSRRYRFAAHLFKALALALALLALYALLRVIQQNW